MIYLSLDLTGNNPDNLKNKNYPIATNIPTNEGQVIVPEFGIFSAKGLIVKHVDTNTTLTLGTDYYLTYHSRHLKALYDIDGFGGIVLTNKTLTGNINITSQQIGGGYVKFNSTVVASTIELIDGVPVNLEWDALVNAPEIANPNTHTLPAENITTGYQEYTAVLWQMSKLLKVAAEKFDSTKIPVGAIITTIEPSPHMNMNYWVTANGQTISKADYEILFTVMNITDDTYVLPNVANSYIRVK